MGILVRTAEVPLRVTYTWLGQLTLRSSPPVLSFFSAVLLGTHMWQGIGRHGANRRRRRRKTGSTATGSPGQKPVQVHAQVHLMPGPAKCIFSTHRQIENVSQLSTSGVSPPKNKFFSSMMNRRTAAKKGGEESAEIADFQFRLPVLLPSFRAFLDHLSDLTI